VNLIELFNQSDNSVNLAEHIAVGKDATIDGNDIFGSISSFQIINIKEIITNQVSLSDFICAENILLYLNTDNAIDYSSTKFVGLGTTVKSLDTSVGNISRLIGNAVTVENTANNLVDRLIGSQITVKNDGTGLTNTIIGLALDIDRYDSNINDEVINIKGIDLYCFIDANLKVTNLHGIHIEPWDLDGAIITNLREIFAADCLAKATYPYFLWFDAPGVFNIDANGAINHYNPAITKYVAGAAIYEKIIQQWNDSVAEIGTQKGSTGTLRKVRLIGAGVEVKDGSTWKDIEAANFVMQSSALRTNTVDAATGRLQAYDVDGAVYVDFITLTNGNTPTCIIKATDFKASDGTSGATFTITIPAVGTITVKNGLITASTLGA